MKKILILMLLLMPFLSMAQKTIFGNLNQQKTDFTRVPIWLPTRYFEIKQKNDVVTIEAKVYEDQMGPHYYTETIPFDGSTVQTNTYGENKAIVSMKWSIDEKNFVLSVRLQPGDNQPSSEFTETWTLENDGKTLVVGHNATQANDNSFKAYYDKK